MSSAPRIPRLLVVLGYSDGRTDALHPICAARLEHAARLAGAGDMVLLSGWSRHPARAAEAELMREAWPGADVALITDPNARHTAENAANAAVHAEELGTREVVVITSSWHRPRARAFFRSLLPDAEVTVVGVDTPGSPRHYAREVVVFPLVPFQLRAARRFLRSGSAVGARAGRPRS